LGAYVTVTDNPKGLPTDIPAALGLLVPDALTQLEGTLEVLAGECNDLRHDELRHGTRVGEGGVEDGNASFPGGDQINLVYTDAEASDNEELADRGKMSVETIISGRGWQALDIRYLRGSLYDSFSDLGLATNANSVILANLLNEVILAHRLPVVIDPPAIRFKCFNGV